MPLWTYFKDVWIQRFGPPIWSNCICRLARLPFTSMVQDYMERILALLCHVKHLLWSQKAELFTTGFVRAHQIGGRATRATSLMNAMAQSRRRRQLVIHRDHRPICQVLHPCPYQVHILGGHFNNTSTSTTKATPPIHTTRIGRSP